MLLLLLLLLLLCGVCVWAPSSDEAGMAEK